MCNERETQTGDDGHEGQWNAAVLGLRPGVRTVAPANEIVQAQLRAASEEPPDPRGNLMTGERKQRKPCGAKSKRHGGPCQQTIVCANGRCKVHGGLTPNGADSPHFVTGIFSRELPRDWQQRYARAAEDPTLLQLRHDVALVTTAITDKLARLRKGGRPVTAKQTADLCALIEQRRKLVEAEARRLKDLSQFVSIAQFRATLALFLALFREFVPDPKDLQEIQRRVRVALLPAKTTDDPNAVH